MTDRFKKIETIFQEALELPSAERAAFLDRACGADENLRQEVESLLAAEDKSIGFMEQPVVRHGMEVLANSQASAAERRIGHYKLLRRTGEGGMSEVYLAVRADDEFQKRVAVKIIRHDLDREDLLRRFRTERQILAGLDHPNIAKLLDGGSTEDGLPYFVMDYIDGVPIDEYCDSGRLGIRERLELFRTVCSAVQYAHQNLVVHRDIKASNILVTPDGVPRLLDFGIAKLLKPDQFAQQVEYTATWLRPMTPRYASPEQVQGKPVTTSSDVYSLGVLLYKLLTGHLPYQLEGRQPTELARLVVEQEPERPSTSISRVETDPGGGRSSRARLTPESVSQSRGTQPQQLRRQLAGDLDNILLMALRKEPQRRYASVEQFSEDIRRNLEGLPVLARKDTFGYRAAKFLRRNRLAVAAAAAFLVLLIGFSVSMTVQAARIAHERDQARRERDRAEEVVAFLEGIFEVSDPLLTSGEDITAREILDTGAESVRRDLGNQPEVQATLMEAIGNVYGNLGLYERARPLLEQALGTRRGLLGNDHPAVAKSLSDLGLLLGATGDYAGAEPLLKQAVELRTEALGQKHPDVAESLYHLARLLYEKGDFEGSERLYRTALEVQRETLGDHRSVADTQGHLAILLSEMGNYPAAEALFREALELRRRLFGDRHVLVAESLNDLGVFLGIQGEYERAEPLFREALAVRREVFGDEHPATAESLNNLGRLLKEKGEYEEAEALYREGLQVERKRLGDEHPRVAILMANLARLLQDKGDYAAAEELAREALAIRRKVRQEHPDLASSLIGVGSILIATARAEEAEPLIREGLEVLHAALPEDHWRIAAAQSVLGQCLAAMGRFEEAEPLLIQGYEGLKAARGAAHPRSQIALQRIVSFYTDWGKPDTAAEYRAKLGE